MADEDAQTKTGGTEMTGATGATGTTGGGIKSKMGDPQTPQNDPVDAPKQPSIDNTKEADVEAQMKTGVLANEAVYGIKTFDCVIARRIFVQKVFAMVGAMLAVVVLMTLLPFVSQNFRIFAIKHDWIWYIAYVFFIITYIAITCYAWVRKTRPVNYITTGVLVFSMGWVTIGLSIHKDTEVVLLALLMTTICCTATIIFAWKTNFDLTKCWLVLVLIGIVMFIFFIIALIARLAFGVDWVYTVYAGLMCLVLMAYLAYDVQMMLGGRRNEISVNDPYYAAVQIFVDIVMMFWYMLQFLQGVRGCMTPLIYPA